MFHEHAGGRVGLSVKSVQAIGRRLCLPAVRRQVDDKTRTAAGSYWVFRSGRPYLPGRVTRSGVAVEHALQIGFASSTHGLLHYLTTLEDEQGGDGLHIVLNGQLLMFVNVDLADDRLSLVFKLTLPMIAFPWFSSAS